MHVKDYHLTVEESANSSINKTSISISRNRPVALIVNACTFLGSHLADYLLEKGIQVVAIDDLSIADKSRLQDAIKHKDFHLLNLPIDHDEVIEKVSKLHFPRLDYGFFVTDITVPDIILGRGVVNFIEIAKQFKEGDEEIKSIKHGDRPRLVFTSSINLYARSVEGKDRVIKEAEVKFAKGIKHFKLNGRVVRLAEVFGPRMDLDSENPLSRLIVASINDKLDDEKISLNFSERSLYIEDAVKLLAKSVISGSTSNKIYDGSLLHPIRLSEIKELLLNPVWSEENNPSLTKLPSWPTPNLVKTMKELSWSAKTPILKALRETTAYFKERQSLVPQLEAPKQDFKSAKSWSFAGTQFLDKEEGAEESKNDKPKTKKMDEEGKSFDREVKENFKKSPAGKTRKYFGALVLCAILIYGLIWPFVYLGYETFNIWNSLLVSRSLLEEGNFDKSEIEIRKAKKSISTLQEVMHGAGIVQKIPGVSGVFSKADQIFSIAEEGVDGILYATQGSRSLFETTKIISGQSREDPTKYYQDAQRDLDFASSKLSKVYASLGDPNLKQGMPGVLSGRVDELQTRVGYYQSIVDQAKSASVLMPKITALGGKKSYLVLIQNNLELRPTGGFIGSYAKLDFEDGRLANLKVDDIYNLDGALKDVIAPPADLKADLGIDRLYLRDSNFDPDFPTSGRLASFFYKKEAGEQVHGVIALDLKASGNLLDAVGGLDLPEYGEAVNGSNLFERAISHAEANFFPGSQAKRNYLTSLQTQLFNKIFYLSKQNWPAIIQAISKSLKEKHILIYLEDPALFSYLASSNWSGVFPRAGEVREGETNDFLAVIESNMGANKSNYYLQRKINLDVSFTKEGKVMHELKINYKNTSPTNVFPAGVYKNRIKIYTPLGTKLNKVLFGETDMTSQFVSFSDYGRTGFSSLIQVAPKEQKTLIVEYESSENLSFKDNVSLYQMQIFKQPGTMQDPLDFILTYPINFKLEQKPGEGSLGVQEVKISTDMQTDRVFEFKIKK